MNGPLIIFFCFVGVCFAQNNVHDCPRNEELNKCANALCKNLRCDTIGKPIVCAYVSECRPGCECQNGYLRAGNDTCVPVDQCEPLPCPHAEMYTKWKKACPENTCDQLNPGKECEEKRLSTPGCICADKAFKEKTSWKCDKIICHCPEISNETWCYDT